MRIGFVEFILILFIASITIGPNVAVWVDRWMRRAHKTSAAAARRRAQMQAQAIAEREYVLHRFQVASRVFGVAALLALVYALILRPIEAEPQKYTPPETSETVTRMEDAEESDLFALDGYENISCAQVKDDWLYLTAQIQSTGKAVQSALFRMKADGSGQSSILTADGEITGFDFDPEGNLWLTVLTANGGSLCRVGHDGWGTAMEQVVTQIDGKALTSPSAVAVGSDGKVYFAIAASAQAKNGLASALRTELIAHTSTGSVYVYDPSARSVQQVLSGLSGASGLALSPDGETLYVSDLGQRTVWAVSPKSRELTAGGKNCAVFQDALPGYPAALAVDETGEVYISFRWARSNWLEDHAGSTLLRGAALRLSQNMQEGLFHLKAEDCALQGYAPDGALLASFGGKRLGSMSALCPAGSRVYLSIPDGSTLRWVRV